MDECAPSAAIGCPIAMCLQATVQGRGLRLVLVARLCQLISEPLKPNLTSLELQQFPRTRSHLILQPLHFCIPQGRSLLHHSIANALQHLRRREEGTQRPTV